MRGSSHAGPEDEPDPLTILDDLGLRHVGRVERVRGGSAIALWRVEHGSAAYALRVFPPGYESLCAREAAAMQAAAAGGIPVPVVHAHGAWQRHPLLLLSWCPGQTIGDMVRRQPWRAWTLGVLFGQAHATIHTIRAPEALSQQPGGWIAWANNAHIERLLRQTPHCDDRLIHLDYHLLNVLTDGRRITGVVDWSNATAGDPRADLARTTTILRLDSADPAIPSILVRSVVALFEAGWRIGYAGHTDTKSERALFYAWAGAAMERDLAPKRGPRDLARIRHWTSQWMRRAHSQNR